MLLLRGGGGGSDMTVTPPHHPLFTLAWMFCPYWCVKVS